VLSARLAEPESQVAILPEPIDRRPKPLDVKLVNEEPASADHLGQGARPTRDDRDTREHPLNGNPTELFGPSWRAR
jgi:hypothetical protein